MALMRVSTILAILLAAGTAAADPVARVGGTVGFQQTDRSAWVIGPSLEVRVFREWSIRGEAQLELGDIDDPFGPSNIRGGDGPHVNHVMFGPSWRPAKLARYEFAAGAQAGVHVMHSQFADNHFTKGPAFGVFAQAGHRLGPIALALQLRFDVSASVDMASPEGDDVPTTTGRINFAFEFPIDVR